jgi:hypothetical protein
VRAGPARAGRVGTYVYFAATLPTLPDIATYHEVAATTTVMRAADGTPLAELASERRENPRVRQVPAAAGAARSWPPRIAASTSTRASTTAASCAR